MAKYRLTHKAVEDLSNIWNYTLDTWSERQADLYYEMLITFCEEIAETPTLGKKYNDVAEGIYGLKANKHIIFYHILSDDEVEIIRILHGSMDIKNRMIFEDQTKDLCEGEEGISHGMLHEDFIGW
ncbi:type II toxin-antitoxin system RelE/ParE family toxin [Bacteroides sp. 51]|uniref:type II toxin-antitoxin system RelE/ParE family toxin n=1 Tax=Bacteroides sp. 51 TaxID=2302938 RepID=UPI0013D6BE85|nr:type II toxin-antitoxin system RelE/ParE family toxin [Bacteroides sp. 51]NDV83829.1 type II toxin-antitoxin system RelE/ParE family toxin [Bacteroides sp. 51]